MPAVLSGKRCVVTGGASGIGRATAVAMARRGATAVTVLDRNDEASATAGLVEALGVKARYLKCDLTSEDDINLAIQQAGDFMEGIDVLHNNAGVADTQVTEECSIGELPTWVWDQIFAVNVRASFLCIKAAVPWLRASESAAIVNCGSVSSYAAFKGESAYCASKAAILLLTKSVALDLQEWGIRCNCYCPGTIQTPLIDTYLAASGDAGKALKSLSALHLTKEPRLGRPEEVASVVCFLASDEASFVNGAALSVDAGALAWRG